MWPCWGRKIVQGQPASHLASADQGGKGNLIPLPEGNVLALGYWLQVPDLRKLTLIRRSLSELMVVLLLGDESI